MRPLLIVLVVVCLAQSAYGLEKEAVEMREDYGSQPLYDCYMNYYYYIPCSTSSWFWSFSGWQSGQVVGEWFRIGDPSMGRAGSGCPPYTTCDPCGAHVLEQFRVLDFAGYGTLYPSWYTVEFNVWCADASGCPVGPSLWTSGPTELCTAGWNYVVVTPQLCLTNCSTQLQNNMNCYPRFLITARHIGLNPQYPEWGFDDISTPLSKSCLMHDTGCCPALYPRPLVSYYDVMHSGDYGVAFEYCPPRWFLDEADPAGYVYGYIELAWRVYLKNIYTETEPTTWGHIKSIYR
jgi:hypothetical protein